MLRLHRPSDKLLRRVLDRQREASYSYREVGATRASEVPEGFFVNRFKAVIGSGEESFARARGALERLQVFDLGWTILSPRDARAQAGETIGILARALGFWSFGVGRIVYVSETEGWAPAYAFAFGTLPEHPIRGEERFSVTLEPADGSVVYEILSFSRPRQLSARLAQRYVRRRQRSFCRDSAEVVRRAAAGGAP